MDPRWEELVREKNSSTTSCRHPRVLSPSSKNVAVTATHGYVKSEEEEEEDGELPLFFPASSDSLLNTERIIDNNPNDVMRSSSEPGVMLRTSEAGWPLASHEMAASLAGSLAGSFRFDVELNHPELQQEEEATVVLEKRPTPSPSFGGKFLKTRQIAASPGASFRTFTFQGVEELDRRHYGFLKPSRQNEHHHQHPDTHGFANTTTTTTTTTTTFVSNAAASPRVLTPRDEVVLKLSNLKANGREEALEETLVKKIKDNKKLLLVASSGHADVKPLNLILKSSQPSLTEYVVSKSRNQSPRTPSSSALSIQSSSPRIINNMQQQQGNNKNHHILGELEIMPINTPSSCLRNNNNNNNEAILLQQQQEQGEPNHLQAVTPPPRKVAGNSNSNSNSIQDQIVSIRKHSLAMAKRRVGVVGGMTSSPSPDHHNITSPHSISAAAVPFNWEVQPGKPKTLAEAAQRALARKLSREAVEFTTNSEDQKLGVRQQQSVEESSSDRCGWSKHDESKDAQTLLPKSTALSPSHNNNTSSLCKENGIAERSGSHRYYGRGHSRESSWGRSSRRYSNCEQRDAHIDLVAPAAAKFLVCESGESPAGTPSRRGGSSPTVAVPFKWEDAPGKAKVEMAAKKPHTLQLPPRLTVSSNRVGSDGSTRDLRGSYFFPQPFAGLFAPCMTAAGSSPVFRQSEGASAFMHQYGHGVSNKNVSLPPKVPSPGLLVGNCNSAPREGCHIRVSKSFQEKGVHPNSNPSKIGRALSGPLPAMESSNVNIPRKLFSSELKPSHPWMHHHHPLHHKGNSIINNNNNINPNPSSSPTSILYGPDEGGSQSSTSNMFSSGDLEAFTQHTTLSGKSASKSGSNTSYGSIEEDFDDPASPLGSSLPVAVPFEVTPPEGSALPLPNCMHLGPTVAEFSSGKAHYRSKGTPEGGVKALLKLCKTSNCLGKPKGHHQQRLSNAIYSPDVWAPTLATYFQTCEATEGTATSGLLGESLGPTSSGYLNSKGEPLALKDLPKDHGNASPKPATRLPYTMPSVAEQELRARTSLPSKSSILVKSLSGRQLTPSGSGANTPARVERYLMAAAHASQGEDVVPSPAYAAALELLSPAVNLMAQRRKNLGAHPKAPRHAAHAKGPAAPKPRRRARFIVSNLFVLNL